MFATRSVFNTKAGEPLVRERGGSPAIEPLRAWGEGS
jgi:hypothetical protein